MCLTTPRWNTTDFTVNVYIKISEFSTVVSCRVQEILQRLMPTLTMESVIVMVIHRIRVFRSPNRKWSPGSWYLVHSVHWQVKAWTGAMPISQSHTTVHSLTPTTWLHRTFKFIPLTAKLDWEHATINPVYQIVFRNGMSLSPHILHYHILEASNRNSFSSLN